MSCPEKCIIILNEVFNEIKDKLPLRDIENISEFIDAGEYGLAFETLCTQIDEYSIKITDKYYQKISKLDP